MKKIAIVVIIIIIIGIGVYFLFGKGYKSPAANSNPASNAVATDKITIKNFAFDPPVITVKLGTTVTWTNEDAAAHQVASDPYPAHTDLPGLFSSPLSVGQAYSFTFDKVGSFGFHCQIHPSMSGKVIVE